MSQYLLEILPYAARGYCCSQILGLLALDAQGASNPGLIRAMGGLCHGMGQCGLTCGVFTGGVCVISYYLGKGADNETASEMAALAVSQYDDWFLERTAQYGGPTCEKILHECYTQKPDMHRCAELIGEGWEKILTILTGLGVDPTEARE